MPTNQRLFKSSLLGLALLVATPLALAITTSSELVTLAGGAQPPTYASFAPSPTCSTGSATFTSSAGSYAQFGKTVFFNAQVVVNVSTVCTYLRIALPFASKFGDAFQAREATTGVGFLGAMAPSASVFQLATEANVGTVSNGYSFFVTGTYQTP